MSEQRTGRWQRIDGVGGNLLLWAVRSVDGETGHCPDGPEGSRKSGLLAVLIGGGEDAAVEMLGDGKTDETVRARTARRKALREGHLPLMTAHVSGRCRRHKPGARSALRVCNRSVLVGNGVDDREA